MYVCQHEEWRIFCGSYRKCGDLHPIRRWNFGRVPQAIHSVAHYPWTRRSRRKRMFGFVVDHLYLKPQQPSKILIMSCPLNRNRFRGSGVPDKKKSTGDAQALDGRLAEMLAIRGAQDGGDWKTRPSWSPAGPDPKPATTLSGPSGSSCSSMFQTWKQ